MAEEKKNVTIEEETKLLGLLKCMGMTLVQKKQNLIGEQKADGTQDYYYTLTVTDGEELLSCTSGKFADGMMVGHAYNLGFNYIDKKLKLVSYCDLGKGV